MGITPHVELPRNRADTIRYCKKDRDFIESLPNDTKTSWSSCLAADNRTEFMDRVMKASPRDYIMGHDRVCAFADKHYAPVIPEYQSVYTDFCVPPQVTDWLGTWDSDRPKTLLVMGPSRTGKTEWARSLGPHMYFCNQFNLSDWNSDAKYMVCDDFSWEYFPNKKVLWGAQKEFSTSDKYKGKRTVRWGKPLIYLCNPDQDPFNHQSMMFHGAKDYYEANCIRIDNFKFFI